MNPKIKEAADASVAIRNALFDVGRLPELARDAEAQLAKLSRERGALVAPSLRGEQVDAGARRKLREATLDAEDQLAVACQEIEASLPRLDAFSEMRDGAFAVAYPVAREAAERLANSAIAKARPALATLFADLAALSPLLPHAPFETMSSVTWLLTAVAPQLGFSASVPSRIPEADEVAGALADLEKLRTEIAAARETLVAERRRRAQKGAA